MLSKMAAGCSWCIVSTSVCFKPLVETQSVRIQSPFVQGFEGTSCLAEKNNRGLNFISRSTRPKISCAMNMSAQQSDEGGRKKLDHLINKAQKLWDRSPQSVKNFPWSKALENFIQLILDLTLAVMKCLSVPVLAVSSLSELSYCAHEKRLFLVTIPFLLGFAVAGILKETLLDSSPRLKDAVVPWHLIAIAIVFTLIKLPGPYFPYWGRILIPHFANGVLLRSLWLGILWHRRRQKALKMSHSVKDSL